MSPILKNRNIFMNTKVRNLKSYIRSFLLYGFHNKVISGFQALRQARAPVAGLEPATEGSLQISGRTRKPLCYRRPPLSDKKDWRRNYVPTIFHIPNPPPQLTPSRSAPEIRISETFSPDITLPQSSDPPAEPEPSNIELISSHENQVKTLKRKLNSEKCRNFRLTKKLKTSKTPRDNTSESKQATAEKEQVEKLLGKYLTEEACKFVLTQIRVAQMKSTSRKWSSGDKSLALSLYHTSKKAYYLLQKIFHLPSPKTLTNSMRNLQIAPGFSTPFLNLFKIKINAMTPNERICPLLLDEISIKPFFTYNPQ
ncbi:transposable element p transposase-like protein [Plakobranchus ocellatus]|uniref:Transposable element p transposase-like protein n=1 Tax=Plakobranchus ocellatus TaxID=259542 RepID=A0AAV4DHK3_9GAST|nr:transposable element p transposase-like protein [Plakobranchus ocellatus]